MKDEKIEILEKLEKPLKLEKKQGFLGKAVTGGLETYVKGWASKLESTRAGEIAGLFTGYKEGKAAQRKAAVEGALKILASLKTGGKPALTLPPPPAAIVEKVLPTAVGPGPAEKRRPAGKIELKTPAMYLAGIGPKRAAALRKLGVNTVQDLLHYYPRDWQDRGNFLPIARLVPGQEATVSGVVRGATTFRTRRGMTITEVGVQDGSGIVFAMYFNQPFQKKRFLPGEKVVLSGKVDFRGRQAQIMNPEAEILPEGEEQLIHTGRIVPLYPLMRELSQRPVRSSAWQALELAGKVRDYLPEGLRLQMGFIPLNQALSQLHFPASLADLDQAKRRLVFDELFLISLGLALRKADREEQPGIKFDTNGSLPGRLIQALPFTLTKAQERVWGDIRQDLARARPMHRLIQGDVGCGKTLLAALALAAACDNGYQGALMAPTEILAEQHLQTLRRFLDPLGVEVLRVVQGQKGLERREVLSHLASGQPLIAVGTHALIQEGVEFGRLGLAVVDEQHRFGVMQRLKLSQKAKQKPHVLVMTATPIPRTLAMTVYGDLDVSVVDELPPGRKKVDTRWLSFDKREEAYALIRSQVAQGRQAYVVYALVDESDKSEWRAATQMAESLRKEVFPDFRVGLLHGRMESEEKDAIMAEFKAGKIRILASTTVIEVGVDVANATVMMVEDADRFGLAQLHQLRGRVGRGADKSFCLLMGDPKTVEGRRRLQVMAETNDGFVIAEEDLRLRGPGEFLGLRQSGLPDLRLADLLRDQAILEEAKRRAGELIARDPRLEKAEHKELLEAVRQRFDSKLELGEVG